MKQGAKQTIRLFLAFTLLGVAVSVSIAGGQWITNHAELAGPDGLSWETTPFTSHVTLPLRSDDVVATYRSRWKEEHLILRLDRGQDAFVELDPESYQAWIRDGQILVQGMVTSGRSNDILSHPDHPAPLPEAERFLIVLHTGEPYPSGDAWYMFAIAALGAMLSAISFRSFQRNRRTREPGAPRSGLFERLAAHYPRLFEALGRFQVNGFGLELMDFHDPRPDGSFLATRWITAGFLPVGPIGRVRIRSLTERVRLWIPFVATATGTYFDTLEHLPVDRSRSLRVYLFYYLVFLPLAVGPVVGLLLWYVLARPDLSAAVQWSLIGACLAWGVGMVWMQDRVMKRPRR